MKRWFLLLLLLTASASATPTVVLPERFKDAPVIVENSPQFKRLVAQNRKLQRQLEQERKKHEQFVKQVDEQRRRDAEALAKAQAASKHKSLLGLIPTMIRLTTSFIANPFAFIISRAIQVLLALVVIGAMIVGGAIVFLKRKTIFKSKPKK